MDWIATVLELVGIIAVCVAAWLISPVLGLATTGVAMFVVGWFMERD
jgi:hypothetical protein